jgi:hypothetical protein
MRGAWTLRYDSLLDGLNGKYMQCIALTLNTGRPGWTPADRFQNADEVAKAQWLVGRWLELQKVEIGKALGRVAPAGCIKSNGCSGVNSARSLGSE